MMNPGGHSRPCICTQYQNLLFLRFLQYPNLDGHNRTNFNSAYINGFSNNQLMRLTMHEMGHALGLNEAQNDGSLYDTAGDSLMDLRTPAQGGQDMRITEGMNNKLEYLGYGVNRNPSINWY